MRTQTELKLPEIYEKSYVPAEFDPELFVSVFISPDISKPLTLTSEQLRFIKAIVSGNYDEGWFAGGNSSGKTWTAKFLATMFATYKIKPGKKGFSDVEEYKRTPYNILCTGPESKQAMELWEHIEKAFKDSPILNQNVIEIHTGTRRNIHPYIKLRNNVIIEAVGLHDKGKHVEGQAYDLILINEPPDVRHLTHCFEKVLFPRTWRRGGIICGFGTPKGKGEYFTLWRRGQEILDDLPNKYFEPRVYSQYSDARTNQFADQETILKGMSNKSEDWVKERVEGRFTDSNASAFKDTDFEMCIDTNLKESIAPSSNHQYITGVDFGRIGDFTAAITWDVSVFPHVQVNSYRAGGGALTWENIVRDLLNIYKKYKCEFVCDSTGMAGDMQQEWLEDLGIPYIPFTFSGPTKKVKLINNLQDYVEKRSFRMPFIEQLVEEIRLYPANMDDKDIQTDMLMALALTAWGARNYEPLGPMEELVK